MSDTRSHPTPYQQICATLDMQVSGLYRKFRPYMQCGKGCSSCCENARFHVRMVEAQALWDAYKEAPETTREAIGKNIAEPAPGRETDCPLLVEGSCSLYSARPALCRAYGALVSLKGEVSTCKLNFNNVPDGLKLDVLEIEPFYDVLDELSARIWQESGVSGTSAPPVFTIREFFSGKLKGFE